MEAKERVAARTSWGLRRVLALSLGPAVGLGIARFGYALLLPSMRTDLEWTYAAAGSMNTANAVGYLLGALAAAPLAGRIQVRHAFWIFLLVTVFALFASGLTADFTLLLLLRFLAGLGGAVVFVTGATLVSHLGGDSKGGSALALGLYFGGVGLGILITAIGLPALLAHDVGSWRLVWMMLGLVSFLALFVAGPAALRSAEPSGRPAGSRGRLFRASLLPSLLAYFLFGLGYITYMTFIFAFMRAQQVSTWQLSLFWALLGASVFVAAFVWRPLIDRARGGAALATLLVVVALGAAVPLASTSLTGVLLSGVLFGGSFLSVVSTVTAIVRRSLPAHAWVAGIALYTIFFSVGQILGPLLSGALADVSGDFRSGFLISAGLLLVAAALAPFQAEPKSANG